MKSIPARHKNIMGQKVFGIKSICTNIIVSDFIVVGQKTFCLFPSVLNTWGVTSLKVEGAFWCVPA